MTPYLSRHSRLLRDFFSLAIISLLVAATGLSLAACGDDEAEGVGTLTDVFVTPEAGYPGVDLVVSLTIEPDGDAAADEYSWHVDFGDGSSRSGEGVEGDAQHSYDGVGQYTIVVEARHNGAVADTVELDFSVYDPVDLLVESVLAQPANVRVDEVATVSFDVRNETASPVLTPFSVRAYLSPDSNVTRENFADRVAQGELSAVGDQQLTRDDDGNVLDGGERRNVSINSAVPDVPTGTYHAVVVIDPEGQLANRTPENTVAVSPGTIQVENIDQALPNIAVGNLEILPDRAFPELNQVTRAFTLSNFGGEDVFNVVHRTYLQVGSPIRDEDAQLIHTSAPVNIIANQEIQIPPEEFVLSEPIVADAGEELEVYVIVEAYSEDGDVVESTQDNNIASSEPPIIVSDEPVDGPDIAVHHFSVSPGSTYLGGSLEVEATIANEGNQNLPSFFCGIFTSVEPQINLSGDPQLSTLNVVGLEMGEARTISREITVPAFHDPGVYYFYLVCDPMDAIDQPFRGNSHSIHLDPITITDDADIDLYIDGISLPESAADGEMITVTTTFCVNGSNPTGTTTADLFTDPGTHVDFDAEPHLSFDVPNINPGECLDVEVEFEAMCHDFNDELSIGIFADASGSLPEDITSNNRQTSNSPVQLEGQYCDCVEDEFGPNQNNFSPAAMDSGTYDAALCDAGDCDFYSVELDAGESLLVTTEHNGDRGALETIMYAPGGVQQLDKDTSVDRQQVGIFVASDDGLNYVFAVCGEDNSTRNYYEIDVEVLPQPLTVDVLPRNIGLPPNDTFSIGSVIDVDFRIYNLGQQVTGEFDVDLVLTNERELGNPEDITLATHTIDTISGGSHRDVVLEAPLSALVDDDEYYIAVVLDPGDVLADENRDNNIGFSPSLTVETNCYDPFTPNDTFSTAAPIDPGVYSNLAACAGSSDYYEICAPNGTSVNVELSFDSTNGDLDATLYNQTLNAIDSSAQTGVDFEQVGVDYVDGAQCYYLRVDLISLDSDATNNYSLDISVNEVAPELQCDPTFEPNDHFETATSLWTALDYDQSINRCPKSDVDFYHVQLSPQSTVDFSVTKEPSNQSGTLRLQLYRPNMVPEQSIETSPGNPTAAIEDFEPPTTGRYYLEVTVGGNEHRVTYDLDASGLPGVDLAARELSIGPGTYIEDDTIRYGFELINYGGDEVDDTIYRVYLGASQSHDPNSDQMLGQFTVTDVGSDEIHEIEGQVNVPSGVTEGTHYFHVIVDPDDDQGDVNRNNNRDTVPIEIVDDPDGGGDGV